MPVNKTLLTIAFATSLIATGTSEVRAQQAIKKPVKATKPAAKVVMLPDFFHYGKVMSGDTTYEYECYDEKEQKINVDEIANAKNINDIYYFKKYYASARRPGSPISPPYLSVKLCSYERSGDASWVSYDHRTKEQIGMNEHVKKIVRSDTAYLNNPETAVKQTVIHKYYKTERVAINAVPNTHTHSHAH